MKRNFVTRFVDKLCTRLFLLLFTRGEKKDVLIARDAVSNADLLLQVHLSSMQYSSNGKEINSLFSRIFFFLFHLLQKTFMCRIYRTLKTF